MWKVRYYQRHSLCTRRLWILADAKKGSFHAWHAFEVSLDFRSMRKLVGVILKRDFTGPPVQGHMCSVLGCCVLSHPPTLFSIRDVFAVRFEHVFESGVTMIRVRLCDMCC